MDKIWDKKKLWSWRPLALWLGWKKRMITQNRQKSNAKNTHKSHWLYIVKEYLHLTLGSASFIISGGNTSGTPPTLVLTTCNLGTKQIQNTIYTINTLLEIRVETNVYHFIGITCMFRWTTQRHAIKLF